MSPTADAEQPSDDAADGRVAREAFDRTLRKATIVWLRVPGGDGARPSHPVWFARTDDRLVLVTGPGEQDVPGLAEADVVTVVARSRGDGSPVAHVDAEVRAHPLAGTSEGDDERIDAALRACVQARLNAPDAATAAEGWRRRGCALVELVPAEVGRLAADA